MLFRSLRRVKRESQHCTLKTEQNCVKTRGWAAKAVKRERRFEKIYNFGKDILLAKEESSKRKRSSEEGRRANALALGAEERRDKLRKATGSCK